MDENYQYQPATQSEDFQPSNQRQGSPYLIPVAIIIAGLFIASAVYLGLRHSQPAAISNSQPVAPTSENHEVGLGTNPVLGSAEAKITIIEFADYQCPFCERFFSQVEPQILDKYVKSGLARFTYRDFAFLDTFANQERGESHLTAEAARCASEQNKFWQYHDKLFQNQKGENEGAFSLENLKKFAQSLDLDLQQFNQCLESAKYQEAVTKDTQEGIAAGITGTPAIFIAKDKAVVDPEMVNLKTRAGEHIIKMRNGTTLVVGALPFSVFEQIIENLLKENS